MSDSSIREALLARRPCFGTWMQFGHPGIAEVLSTAGFSWIAADCEHGEMDEKDVASLVRAVHGRGVAPLVRVRENDTLAIRRVLDLGATGVIVPLVNSAAEAHAAVRAATYPPRGIRGFAFHRGNDYGVHFDEYIDRANREISVVTMVESREAVENIDEILAVEGLDGVFVGPYDLGGSYGVVGRTDDPVITAALVRVVEACEKAGKAAGTHVVLPAPSAIRSAIDAGFTFIALGMDDVFLEQGARAALEAARGASR